MSYDVIALIISGLLVGVYYLHLGRLTRRSPDSSIHKRNATIRARWVDMVMNSGKMDILAIQTLRNSVMAASFMATTAMLLIIGTLNLTDKIQQWSDAWQPTLSHWHPVLTAWFPALLGHVVFTLWQIKLTLLLLDFFVAFFCFSMSIRFFNHVGYMISLTCDRALDTDLYLYKQTCAYLNRAGSYYTFGTRIFFFSIPMVMWFFSPCFLVISTLGLIVGLAMLDKAPKP